MTIPTTTMPQMSMKREECTDFQDDCKLFMSLLPVAYICWEVSLLPI